MGSRDKTKARLSAPTVYDAGLFSDDAASMPLQRLLCIARQSGVGEPSSCAATLLLLSAGRAVRHGLQRIMKPLGMSEARFLSLVTLYTLDPVPSCPANLAYHVEITRTAMTDTLDQMEKHGWVRRERLATDRRVVRVFLTDDGREIAANAIRHFLKAASVLAESLKPAQHKVFAEVCLKLRQRAEALPAN
ncbi:MAG: MarR family transcriptional regulator [Nibricoccus sp.]